MDDIQGIITENRNITSGHYLLKVRLERAMDPMAPGQFVMLEIPRHQVFLRRPFSIYSYQKGLLTLMYKVVGAGTGLLSEARENEKVRVLCPLGKGFQIKGRDAYLVVAGGIGIAGVRAVSDLIKGSATVFYGCSNKDEVALVADMEGFPLHVATIDGAYGFKGTVVELLSRHIPSMGNTNAEVLACGPHGMMQGLRALLKQDRTPCQVLIEERMACGLGLCFGCVTRTSDEKEPFKRVCKEGPVFDLWEISL